MRQSLKKPLIRFTSDVFAAVAVVDAKNPYYCMLLLDAYCRPVPCVLL